MCNKPNRRTAANAIAAAASSVTSNVIDQQKVDSQQLSNIKTIVGSFLYTQ